MTAHPHLSHRMPFDQPAEADGGVFFGGQTTQSNMMLQMGINYGQAILQQGIHKSEQGILQYTPFFSNLRVYFRVDNQYVRRKLAMLIFPFIHRFPTSKGTAHLDPTDGNEPFFGSPVSQQTPSSTSGGVPAPTSDAHAFDLYIPLMGVITYVILSAFTYGLLHRRRVTIEYFASTTTVVAVWLLVEVALARLIAYGLHVVPSIALLDTLSLCGYKYVLICLAVLLRQLLPIKGGMMLTTVMICFALASICFFAIKTVLRAYARDDGRVPSRGRLLAYAVAALQAPAIIWLSVRPFYLRQSPT